MINATQIRKGMVIKIEGEIYRAQPTGSPNTYRIDEEIRVQKSLLQKLQEFQKMQNQ